MTAPPAPLPRLYTTAEVAALLAVHPDTITRADQGGKFPEGTVIRTPGGHRRFDADYIDGLLNGGQR